MNSLTRLSLLVPAFVLVVLSTSASSQWNWAMRAGGGYRDYNDPSWLTTDKNGDVIFAGGIVNNGNGDIDGIPITDCPIGGFAALIMKYSSAGEKRWVKYFGVEGELWSSWGAQARGVAVDSSNNIYVVGTFSKTITVDGERYTAAGGESDNQFDIFLCKLDPNGTVVWMKTFGTPSAMDYTLFFAPIHVTPQGKIIILGTFGNSINFDGKLITRSDGDYFITQFSRAGTCEWVKAYKKEAPVQTSDVPENCDVDRNGNIYVIATQMYLKSQPSDPEIHIKYLMKLDSTGQVQWYKDNYILQWIKTDDKGLINYGDFMNEFFEHDWRVTANGLSDVALARYTFDGEFQWRRTYGGEDIDGMSSLSVAPNGDLYFGFGSWGAISIGGEQYPERSKEYPIHTFFLHCDEEGKLIQHSKSNDVLPSNTAMNEAGELFVTGKFSFPLDFGATKLTPVEDSETGGYCSDLFVGKYSFPTSTVSNAPETRSFTIYPSVATTTITVVVPENVGSEHPQFIMYNILGAVVLKATLDQEQQSITIADLPTGMYRCTLVAGEHVFHATVTVMR